MLQTSKTEKLRIVGFASEKHGYFSAASSNDCPVKLSGAKLSPTKDGGIEVFIENNTKLEMVKKQLDFKRRKVDEGTTDQSVPKSLE
ncbi:hypothetical protein FSP39_021519 [Pinctada imbricata]|uniref:Uncharacterized protein n=1 Tax=Pinctada imbricata TaxID=66713 RepID=A0AA89BMT7_PINIB|nr:hypothetical protein FSP39_021519 [Pinctada imbricata]